MYYQSILTKVFYFVFILFSLSAAGQKPLVVNASEGILTGINGCGTDAYLRQSRLSEVYRAREAKMNHDVAARRRSDAGETLTLPVVVHIMNQNPDAISDQAIINAVKDLNDAFGKTGNYTASIGADTKIRFCLTQKDPDGGISTGITRTTTFYADNINPSTEDARLKNLIQWDPKKYINIWYVSSISDEAMAWQYCEQWTRVNTSGYATMPPNGGALDGIVVTGFYKVLAHEMGHYLGLYHTFEGGCTNNNCTVDGDKVCDTPPDNSAGAFYSCSSPGNTCSTDTLSGFTADMPDMVSDFMDYSNDACANAFTAGQTERMRNAIMTERSGLLDPRCEKPCTASITAAFSGNNANPVAGNTIEFTNKSTNASTYQWLVNGAIASTSANFSFTFNTPGKHKVTLKAFNNTTCFASYSDFVIVTCGVTARFYADKKIIASSRSLGYTDSIYFTNTSVNATSYKWLVSNNAGMEEREVSSDLNLKYTFDTAAIYWVRLIAIKGNCSDTTEKYVAEVLNPSIDGVIGVQSLECFNQTKLKLSIYFCNYGFMRIYQGVPVSFYDSDPRLGNAARLYQFILPDDIPGQCCTRVFDLIIDAGRSKLNTLYIAFNDAGITGPLKFPNTHWLEKNYNNNVVSFTNISFRASINPAAVIAEPGDTVRLTANVSTGLATSYTWSPSDNLSCVQCRNTSLVANSTVTKRLIAESQYGCADTASVDIKVPPANDYTLHINEVKCSPKDSLSMSFNISNAFKRGVIPKGLKVSFYKNNPASSNAVLLPPVFVVPDTVHAVTATFNAIIPGKSRSNLYAKVNYDGALRDTAFMEKNYANNDTVFVYSDETVSVSPADTTVFRKQSFSYTINTPLNNPADIEWFTSGAYNLSCTTCSSPVITVYNNSKVQIETVNKYGCRIKGEANVSIYPPDMTVKIINTECYSANKTRVTFQICMNNGYDSVFQNIPVVFYDSTSSGNTMLYPVFYTNEINTGSCHVYSAVISTPASSKLHAIVNSKSADTSSSGSHVYAETNYENNTGDTSIIPFAVTVVPSDTAILPGQSISFNTSATGGTIGHYSWSPSNFLSCTNCSVPVVTPKYNFRYLLTARNENSCIDTAYVTIRVNTNNLINIADAFTPNGDGLNDIFYISGSGQISQVNNFTIFNRWGQKLFEANSFLPNDPAYGWSGAFNGVPSGPGTYVYSVTITLKDGTKKTYKGTVLLIR